MTKKKKWTKHDTTNLLGYVIIIMCLIIMVGGWIMTSNGCLCGLK